MIEIDIEQIQAELLRLLEQGPGEHLIRLRKNGAVIADVRVTPTRWSKDHGPRPLGLAQGQGTVLPSFFDPLPDDLLKAFEGKRS